MTRREPICRVCGLTIEEHTLNDLVWCDRKDAVNLIDTLRLAQRDAEFERLAKKLAREEPAQ